MKAASLVFPQLTEALTPFEDKPQARKIVDADGGNLTLMELAAGQSWHEHHSVHPHLRAGAQGRGDLPREGPRYYPWCPASRFT